MSGLSHPSVQTELTTRLAKRLTAEQAKALEATDAFERICLWLIGFASTLDILALKALGSTPILVVVPLAVVYVLYEFIKHRGTYAFKKSPANIPLNLFLLYAAVSALFPLFNGNSDIADVSLKGLVVLASMLLVFKSVTMNPSAERLKAVTNGLLVGVAANALYGIYQFIGSYRGWPWLQINGLVQQAPVLTLHRAEGFFREPSYFVALLVPALLLSLYARGRRSFLLTSVIAISLFLSFSLGALLAVAAVVAWFLILVAQRIFSPAPVQQGRKQTASVVLALVLVAIIIVSLIVALPPVFNTKQIGRFNPASTANAERARTIRDSFNLALQHPLGVGYAMGPSIMEANGFGDKIHSLMTALALEVGFIGLVLFIAFVLFAGVPLLKEKGNYRLVALGIAAIISMLYSFITFNSFFYFEWIIWGLAVASYPGRSGPAPAQGNSA